MNETELWPSRLTAEHLDRGEVIAAVGEDYRHVPQHRPRPVPPTAAAVPARRGLQRRRDTQPVRELTQ